MKVLQIRGFIEEILKIEIFFTPNTARKYFECAVLFPATMLFTLDLKSIGF